MATVATKRIAYREVEGAARVFTPEFDDFLLQMHDQFAPRIDHLMNRRREVLDKALQEGILPNHLPPSEATTGDWKVAPYPEELNRRGIEISGPASITGMFINALNPGPEGERAEGDLDDDEDSAGHRLVDTVNAAINRQEAVEGTLSFFDAEKGKQYSLREGEIPFFMHRERGLHLSEPEFKIDGNPVKASILGTALTLFHVGRAQAERGQGIYFYIPKLESAEEAAYWKDFFDAARDRLAHLKDAVIKAIPLIESLPAAYQMEEILYALQPYGVGLNAARWDYQASILEFVMSDPDSVWPDRFGVDIKTTHFLGNGFRRLVAICLKRGGIPIGGMATALPSKDDEVNRQAAAAIRKDKVWEAQQGFLRGWVAHIFHMKTAADPFRELHASGWTPDAGMSVPENYPLEIKVPEGPITILGTRRNARTMLEYLEGWLGGRGAKGIDSMAAQSGSYPALMEDLATARISVAQIAQRIRHGARDQDTGTKHGFALVKKLLEEELDSILELGKSAGLAPELYEIAALRYRKAFKVALRWIKNYVDLNFRALGTYSRRDLEGIADEPDAF